jgi:hypothetical protein
MEDFSQQLMTNFNYPAFVSKCREEKLNIMVPNSTEEHATILIKNIIQTAKEKISILTGECKDDFYCQSGILEEFESFIDRTEGHGEINIIIENGFKREVCDEFINRLKSRYTRLGISPLPLKVSELEENNVITLIEKGAERKEHFIVVDNDGAFRYEKHPTNPDDDIEASANFGNQRLSRMLQKAFDSYPVREVSYS